MNPPSDSDDVPPTIITTLAAAARRFSTIRRPSPHKKKDRPSDLSRSTGMYSTPEERNPQYYPFPTPQRSPPTHQQIALGLHLTSTRRHSAPASRVHSRSGSMIVNDSSLVPPVPPLPAPTPPIHPLKHPHPPRPPHLIPSPSPSPTSTPPSTLSLFHSPNSASTSTITSTTPSSRPSPRARMMGIKLRMPRLRGGSEEEGQQRMKAVRFSSVDGAFDER